MCAGWHENPHKESKRYVECHNEVEEEAEGIGHNFIQCLIEEPLSNGLHRRYEMPLCIHVCKQSEETEKQYYLRKSCVQVMHEVR